nr:DEAD/DEAH box helicase family protein [Sediminivirga luteola]
MRRHQREALRAWRRAHDSGARRSWIVLPPGAGKTRVGVEAVRASGRKGVVFSPNTAIQAQWAAADPALRSLTYQSLAVFDAEREDRNGDDDDGGGSELSRLHPNGLRLVEELAAAGDLMLVLDECHHLLRTWGRLLAEVLQRLPQAHVLGLTATPAASMTAAEAALEADLFGGVTYQAQIPEVVREGDLAPYLELPWLTTPTPTERDWLRRHDARVQEFLAHLGDPEIASVPLLESLDALTAGTRWADLEAAEPELADAVARLAHAGTARLPEDAVLRERHRQDPGVADWMRILEHWLKPLNESGDGDDPRDRALIDEVAGLLPSLGYRWTRRGIVRSTPTADRVLARSGAKARATADILGHESATLGEELRGLVLCDFESAATLPRTLHEVVDPAGGSARAVLRALLDDPATAELRPLLVTARTVAGEERTLRALAAFAKDRLPEHTAAALVVEHSAGSPTLEGWNARQWVPVITEFFARGGSRVLIGTRGLLGEGWDARCVNTLIDLTSATTPTAIVQMRGRALRLDPAQPGKVAAIWTVTTLAEGLLADGDWQRLVRKHDGHLAPDSTGELVDGVAHLDDGFSAHHPPAPDLNDEVNARAVRRSQRREEAARLWRSALAAGTHQVSVVRARERHRAARAGTDGGRPVQPVPRTAPSPIWRVARISVPVLAALALILVLAGFPAAGAGALGACLVAGTAVLVQVRRRHLELARPPGIVAVAAAVAEAMHEAGLLSRGAEAISARFGGSEGELRCRMTGVPAEESARFAAALDEAVQPLSSPRYIVSRSTVAAPTAWAAMRATLSGRDGQASTWHPVPAELAGRRETAELYLRAWRRWVGEGELLYAKSPEGAGVVAAARGDDPWQVSTAIRLHWA